MTFLVRQNEFLVRQNEFLVRQKDRAKKNQKFKVSLTASFRGSKVIKKNRKFTKVLKLQ
jgi:hypothetical protein